MENLNGLPSVFFGKLEKMASEDEEEPTLEQLENDHLENMENLEEAMRKRMDRIKRTQASMDRLQEKVLSYIHERSRLRRSPENYDRLNILGLRIRHAEELIEYYRWEIGNYYETLRIIRAYIERKVKAFEGRRQSMVRRLQQSQDQTSSSQ